MNGLGTMGGSIQRAPETPLKQANVYERHHDAAQRYQDACYSYQKAVACRDQARVELEAATKALAETMQQSLLDPTQPQAAEQCGTRGY